MERGGKEEKEGRSGKREEGERTREKGREIERVREEGERRGERKRGRGGITEVMG